MAVQKYVSFKTTNATIKSMLNSNYKTGSKKVRLIQDGQTVGEEDVFIAHTYPPKLHGAVSAWIIAKRDTVQPNFLLQQRSSKKILAANWWANTACGNVKPDESFAECADRRIREELGVDTNKVELKAGSSFLYKAYGNEQFGEYEFDQLFFAIIESPNQLKLNPDSNEVQATAWVSVNELISWASSLEYPTAEETITQSWDQLKQSTKPQLFTYQEEDYLIAPWTILILRDTQFQQKVSALLN